MSNLIYHTPSVEERLRAIKGATAALDIVALQVAEGHSQYTHAGEALLFIAEALKRNHDALSAALEREHEKTGRPLNTAAPSRDDGREASSS